MRRLPLLLVSLAHFCVDSYATMLAPVLPLVIDRAYVVKNVSELAKDTDLTKFIL